MGSFFRLYGGDTDLFASLWISRMPSDEAVLVDNVVNSLDLSDGKPEIRDCVRIGMPPDNLPGGTWFDINAYRV